MQIGVRNLIEIYAPDTANRQVITQTVNLFCFGITEILERFQIGKKVSIPHTHWSVAFCRTQS